MIFPRVRVRIMRVESLRSCPLDGVLQLFVSPANQPSEWHGNAVVFARYEDAEIFVLI